MPACAACNERHEQLYPSADGNVCLRCFEESRWTCDVCNQRITDYDDSAIDPLSGVPICTGCWESLRPSLLPDSTGRTVGFEFEMILSKQNTDPTKMLRDFGRITTDGSICPTTRYPYAIELQTHFGGGESLTNFLDNICTLLSDSSTFSHNRTCGLHVHLGMRGSTGTERRQLYKWWQALEPAIYLLVTPDRISNSYCRSAREYAYARERYCSLNTLCYANHHSSPKTFEARLHHATFDRGVVGGWTQFLLSFFNTFQYIEATQKRIADVIAMNSRDKMLFMMQQVKAPLSLYKYAIKAMKNNRTPHELTRAFTVPDNWRPHSPSYNSYDEVLEDAA